VIRSCTAAERARAPAVRGGAWVFFRFTLHFSGRGFELSSFEVILLPVDTSER
jgi:hypothetical protein